MACEYLKCQNGAGASFATASLRKTPQSGDDISRMQKWKKKRRKKNKHKQTTAAYTFDKVPSAGEYIRGRGE